MKGEFLMKLIRKIAALGAAAMMMASMSVTNVSAITEESNDVEPIVTEEYSDTGYYCSYNWGYISAETINITATQRRVSSYAKVYRDGTGAYVTSTSATKTGGYGTSACASLDYSTYPSSQYNFKLSGEIYNSTPYESGIVESWGPKPLA